MFSSEKAKLTFITKIEANVKGNLAQYVVFLPLFVSFKPAKGDFTCFVENVNRESQPKYV